MRRLAAGAVLVPLAILLVPTSPASAQGDEQDVRLILQSQTTTASRTQPFELRVRAINDTDRTLRDLRLVVSVFAPTLSRSAYDEALEAEFPFSLATNNFPVRQTLEPNSEITVDIEWELRQLADEGQSRLYPVGVQLLSEFEPVAELRTALVFQVEEPIIGLNVSLTFVLDAPLVLGPRGVFADDTLERALAPGGHLRAVVDTLRDLEEPIPVTLALSPVLLQELQTMTDDGYQVLDPGGGQRTVGPEEPGAKRAERTLEGIAEIARRPETQIVSLPYASPSLAALSGAGLDEDVELQLERGREAVEERLGVEPSASLAWPPASVLTGQAVEDLASAGIDKLIVDADTLPPPTGSKFTPPSSARLDTEAGSTLRVLTPDPLVAKRIASLPQDPRLRAQWVLGELAQIYFEFPGRDRGVGIVFDEDDRPEPVFLRRLLSGIASTERSPWVRAVAASRLLEPQLEPPPDRRELPDPGPVGRFPSSYLEDVANARDAIGQLASIGADPELVGRLGELVLLSQSRYLLADDERRRAYLDRVHEKVSEEFAKIQVPERGSVTTLTALGGRIPVTIRNLAGRDLKVQIRLESSRPLEFIGGNTRVVTLELPAQRFEFPVRAATTGRFPVSIQVTTPLGAEVASTDIVVRSTAYNRVALFVTIGAALFLFALWARRFLPRRR